MQTNFVYLHCSTKLLLMAITFFTQSKKDFAPIYIRVVEGRSTIDAKAKTRFSVNPDRLEKSKIKTFKNPKGANAETKKSISELNAPLIKLQEDLDALTTLVTTKLNQRSEYEIINSKWLKNIVTPESNVVPTDLVSYSDVYLNDPLLGKNKEQNNNGKGLRHSTKKKIKSIISRLKTFEEKNGTIYLEEINKEFRAKLFKWHDDKGYAHNTKIKALKVVITICNHALENGQRVHPESTILAKKLEYNKTPHVYLNFQELEAIEKTSFDIPRMEHAKDWLLISCNTAQRVSDFLKFSIKDITEIEDGYLLDINQEKTGEPISIPLNETVIKILNKYDWNFPPLFSENVDSNEVIYNLLIKQVCSKAKINEVVKANLRQTKKNRYEIKEVAKWKAVSSHIGRRSFATNYYGKINTALLISMTGHATEKQFLTYVGKKPQSNALALAKELKRLSKKPILTVVKDASNG